MAQYQLHQDDTISESSYHQVIYFLTFKEEENEEDLNQYVGEGYETKLTRDLGEILSV